MTSRDTLRVGLVGGRGFVGAELLGLFGARKDISVSWLTSTTAAGRPVAERITHAPPGLVFSSPNPEERLREPIDVLVLALPNGETGPWLKALAESEGASRILVLDLGADHRGAVDFVYGLPARRRDEIRNARRIANPGCYATAIEIALDPLVPWLEGTAYAFGVSGYSGAGTTPSPRNDPERLRDNVSPYCLVDHVHEREVAHELEHPVRLLPHVAPFFRGISVTLTGSFDRVVTRRDVVDRMGLRWAYEPLVSVKDEAPQVRDNRGRHDVHVGGVEVGRDGRSFSLVATVDNLLGGAATTALRNMNLATGRAELEGIVL